MYHSQTKSPFQNCPCQFKKLICIVDFTTASEGSEFSSKLLFSCETTLISVECQLDLFVNKLLQFVTFSQKVFLLEEVCIYMYHSQTKSPFQNFPCQFKKLIGSVDFTTASKGFEFSSKLLFSCEIITC